jgi:type IV pilus assembly protein PilV
MVFLTIRYITCMKKFTYSVQRGFSMIEVLVAIFILTIGMLSILGLQLQALRGNQQASQTAVAASLVRDYQEILTSIPSITASATASAVVNIDKNTYTGYSGTATECKGTGATCTNQQFADFQTKEWIERVKNSLPAGVATVCIDTAYVETSGTSQGLYKWSCNNSGDILVLKIGWANKLEKDGTGRVIESGVNDGTDRPRMVIPLTGNQEGYKL